MKADTTTIRRAVLAAALAQALGLAAGCTSVKTTGTSRSGTEQLLLTGTWDAALCRVDFRPLAGSKVFLDDKYVTVIDKDWITSSIRRTMARQGVLLENNRDHAQVVVEPSLAAYGTDDRNCTTGLPQAGNNLTLPAFVGLGLGGAAAAATATSSSNNSAAMAISQTYKQDAVVKAALFAYDAHSGQMIWESGPLLAVDGYRDRLVFGAGPNRISSSREVEDYPDVVQSKVRKRPWRSLSR